MAKMTVKTLIKKLQEIEAATPGAKVYFRDEYTEDETPIMIDCSLPQKKNKVFFTWHPDYTR